MGVWFSAYNFGSGFDGHEKSRSKIYKIEKDTAARVLNSIAQYFSTEYIEVFATDIGEWEMEITNTDGEVHKYCGSLIADFEVDGVDLSDMVREALWKWTTSMYLTAITSRTELTASPSIITVSPKSSRGSQSLKPLNM